jgi:N-methylhydantoinase B
VNDGFYRLVSLNAPRGTVVNCTWPAPVVGGWETQTRLVDVLFRALLPALPERLPAGTKAMMCHAGFGGVDPESGEYTCFLETFGGGYGGRPGATGPTRCRRTAKHRERAGRGDRSSTTRCASTRLSLSEDSDGPAAFRGGLGLRKDFRFDRPTTFTVLADRTVRGPWGVSAERTAGRAEYVLIRDGRRDAAAREDDARGARRRHDLLPARAAAAATGRRPSATQRSSRVTCARARSATARAGRCTGGA